MGAVAEWFFVALTATAEAERFFFDYDQPVSQSDFGFSAFNPGGSIGNDSNF